MLKDKRLIEIAEQTAQAFNKYEAGEAKAKKTRINAINSLLDSKSRKAFIENLIPLLGTEKELNELLNSLVEKIDSMQADLFPHFLVLLKFKYSFYKSNN